MPTDPSPANPAPAAGRSPGHRILPEDADLDHLRGQCRTLQRAVRRGDPDAVRRVAAYGLVADQGFALSSAQLVVAREYGFVGWPRLKHYLQTIARYRWDPSENTAVERATESPADRFCRLACLGYTAADGPDRWSQAAELLAQDPGIVDLSIWAAGAAADVAALRRHLAADPAGPGVAATRRGGPYRWTPLFYLVYSRLGVIARDGAGSDGTHGTVGRDTTVAARLLLDAGADPHEGYLWHGLPTPFTLLTGAFGEGEQGPLRQPRHPDSLALARQFLDAGADPSDGQALYNRMFGTDDDHLRLLFGYGLGQGDGGPWRARLGEALDTPQQLLRGQLGWAVDHRQGKRVKLLVEHGVDVRTPFADGRTPPPGPCATATRISWTTWSPTARRPRPRTRWTRCSARLWRAMGPPSPGCSPRAPGLPPKRGRPVRRRWSGRRRTAGRGAAPAGRARFRRQRARPWGHPLRPALGDRPAPGGRGRRRPVDPAAAGAGCRPVHPRPALRRHSLDWAHHLGRPEAARELAD